jgi:hypothetical protein
MMGALLLAWWFAMAGPSHSVGRVVGPFESKVSCEIIRLQVTWNTTVCWSDGKP